MPNSEAAIVAQHNGIADRTVGAYYMSEQYKECYEFLNCFKGEFIFDLEKCISNAKKVYDVIKQNKLEDAFKNRLVHQMGEIDALEWLINKSGIYHKMPNPTVNENKKYLKLDNLDQLCADVRTMMLGDLFSLYFKKIGDNGFIVYLDLNPKFTLCVIPDVVRAWL